jgi:hypothetical protein
MTTTIEYQERMDALKAHLIKCGEFSEQEAEEFTYEKQWDSFCAYGYEYLVLTDEEAVKAVKESILETLWAFNPRFVVMHTKFYLESSIEADEAFEEALKEMQSKLCEDANPIIRALIVNIDDFVENAIQADGRGHFLSSYDGEEIELNNGKYYAYRIN